MTTQSCLATERNNTRLLQTKRLRKRDRERHLFAVFFCSPIFVPLFVYTRTRSRPQLKARSCPLAADSRFDTTTTGQEGRQQNESFFIWRNWSVSCRPSGRIGSDSTVGGRCGCCATSAHIWQRLSAARRLLLLLTAAFDRAICGCGLAHCGHHGLPADQMNTCGRTATAAAAKVLPSWQILASTLLLPG